MSMAVKVGAVLYKLLMGSAMVEDITGSFVPAFQHSTSFEFDRRTGTAKQVSHGGGGVACMLLRCSAVPHDPCALLFAAWQGFAACACL